MKMFRLSQILNSGFGAVFLFEKTDGLFSRYPKLKGWLLVAVIFFAAIAIYMKPYLGRTFYPRCPLFCLTGLHCPGCGSTRSLAALSHGNIADACRKNIFVVAAVPFVTAGLIIYLLRCFGVNVKTPFISGKLIMGLFILVLAFFVLRNISLYPFNLLAPH
ncbi:MAG: DUF2752 domain-containing protein [Lentisphaerae bacterium]|nr:DUF2752 domain-containing protein [Lentisphaerota bacterium]MCP4102252.1 DUF2752 domain-containing protein [Lentisphaerota bacterium]